MTTINVTQRHIDDGVPGDPCNCAIAQAVAEVVRPEVEISVAGDVELCAGELVHYFDLPEEALDFSSRFDLQGPTAVQPFSFDAEIPSEFLRTEVAQ